MATEEQKRQARIEVMKAQWSGRIVRPSACSRCPATKGLEAHHGSYEPDRWLDVEWLCTRCHSAIHHAAPSACDARTQSAAVGARVRAIRLERQMSQMEFSNELHISQSTLSKLELGVIEWTIDRVVDVAAALGVPAVVLLGGGIFDVPTVRRDDISAAA